VADIDGLLHVVTADSRPGERLWRICSGGSCLVNRNLGRLMEAYRALLLSQGQPVGDE
jgi:hypothetical protein